MLVYALSSRASAESILQERAHLQSRVAPSLQDLITENSAKPYEYRKSWDEAKDDPWLIFHTSGTTGQTGSPCQFSLPKLTIALRPSETGHLYEPDDDIGRCGPAATGYQGEDAVWMSY